MGDSPEWLRSFQVPRGSILSLSSDSNSSPSDSPQREGVTDPENTFLFDSSKLSQSRKRDHGDVNESDKKSPSVKISKAKSAANLSEEDGPQKKKIDKMQKTKGKRDESKIQSELTSKCIKSSVVHRSVWTLSSDSDSCPDDAPTTEDNMIVPEESGEAKEALLPSNIEGSCPQIVSSRKSPRKESKTVQHSTENEKSINNRITDEENAEKQNETHVSTSRLTLLLPEKVLRSKALVECEGESIELSGDMGAVGRIVMPDTPLGDHEMYLDLKGTIYKTTIVPSRTFCVVSFGQSEAKIEAIMNDFIQLKPQSNVYEAETMVEGTMNGFSFDSEDEVDKMPNPISHQTDENEGIEEPSNGKLKGKPERTPATKQKKKERVAGGGKPQQPKRARKKTVVSSKKTKSKK